MGAALSWVAVRGKPTAEILGELRLRPTGVPGLAGEALFAGAPSDGGWYLIVMRGVEHRLLHPAVLERLSAGCEVLTCTVEEHVMFSQATRWQNGRRLWAVTHEGEGGPVGIAEEGPLPPEYPPIRDRLTAQQEAEGGAEAAVDCLFEIPLVLAQTFVGYRHDEPSPAFEAHGFEVLEPEPSRSGRPSWLGRLFARRRDA